MTEIFVFGSNLAGRHGKGAALTALKEYGAIYGQGEGLQGNSYGIPTKDRNLQTLDLETIKYYTNRFMLFVEEHPKMVFHLTPVGCGLAGYKRKVIKPLFLPAPNNLIFLDTWEIKDD